MTNDSANLYQLKNAEQKVLEIELAKKYIKEVLVAISGLAIDADKIDAVYQELSSIIIVADNISSVLAVEANEANINIVANDMDKVISVVDNMAEILIVAGIEAEILDLVSIKDNILDVTSDPLRQAILDAEGNATNAEQSAVNAAQSAIDASTNGQLEVWKAEAQKMTADSYATEPHNVYVKTYASNGDGTFTPTDTTEYSALHYEEETKAVGIPQPNFPADEGLALIAHQTGNEWGEILGLPDETNNAHKTVTTKGTKGDSFWSPLVTSPVAITENITLAAGANASIVSPEIEDGIEVTIPDGSILCIL